MADELRARGVRVVALSKDSAADAARHKLRDGLSMTVLSDEKLEVIRLFGVEHHKALEFSTVSFVLFGIPLALVPSIKTMAIPTSLLIDEDGTILWIDQSDDYRLRSDPQHILKAVDDALARRPLT